jgi:hypothetical protein
MAKIVANTGTRSTKAPLAKALKPVRKGPGGPMVPIPRGGGKGPGGPMQPLPKGSPGPGSGGFKPIPKGRGRGPMKPGMRPR